jgi:hypothetical protein
MPKIERCSCPESQHLRKALTAIQFVCMNDTGQPMVEDLAQCANLAGQGLMLLKLTADPGVGDIAERTKGLVP